MGSIPITDAPINIPMRQFNLTDDATKLGHCVHKLIERAADVYRNNIAVICADEMLTYAELDQLANRLAVKLVKRGVRQGDLVALAVDRSVNLVIAIIGILKAGAAYVPIDPGLPQERIRQIVQDSDPKIILTGPITADNLMPWNQSIMRVCEALETQEQSETNLDAAVSAEDIAYVIYTSGSTGRPKGVEMSHSAVSNYLSSMANTPGCSGSDRILAVTTISFDMSVPELLMPLLSGATTVIAQTHQVRDPWALLELIEHHGITIMQGTPAIWQMLLDSGWMERGGPRLSKILSSGEGLPRRLADGLLACADSVWNLYGPTETSYVTVWRVVADQTVIIGQPIANAQLYVLDQDFVPCEISQTGELFIGGACVARGYLNAPKLTSSCFINNPFQEGIMYRTGDLACFVSPQKLRLIGRVDNQVKINGYRIELGDIEAAITGHKAISAAVVLSQDDRLVAYCKWETSTEASTTLDRLLRPWLAERLPAYMVPAFFIAIDAFPMTTNGKVDRKALPKAFTGVCAPPAKTHVAGLEGIILDTWCCILGHAHIGLDDNFFHVGGDSVRAVRAQTALAKVLGRPVSTAKLFEHFTVRTLAAYLNRTAETKQTSEERPAADSSKEDAIAIVSMACRLPGGVNTPEEFWTLLDQGTDAISDVPKTRWDAEALYDANPNAPGKSYCRQGGFLYSIESFDSAFFGISPREAQAMNPEQRITLEVCWEGFERAGYTMKDLRGSRTGVFVGVSHHAASYAPQDLDGYTITGSAAGTLSGRVSYTLGLQGPALTVDTACSSSLVATHLGCNALRQGECDLVVAAGTTLMLTPGLHVEFSKLRGMSQDGRCRAFAQGTQGTGWGEGVAAVILKRLTDAQRDGDMIHAVVKATAVNQNGRSSGLTRPSGGAQERLIRTALASARLEPGDIDYIEAHGTATQLGDPIEAEALDEVFGGCRPEGARPIWIGSAKSNLGHTQGAAGLVGIIKVALALQQSTLPQTLHIAEPTRAVDWKRANMAPIQEKQPWPTKSDRLRRAGVSAFGIGGTNAHVVVEEAPPKSPRRTASTDTCPLPPVLPLLLSATTDAALQQQAAKLRRHMNHATDRFGDLAFSLATTRNHFRHRMVVMARSQADLITRLDAGQSITSAVGVPSDGVVEPRLAMLFTGQGSQYQGMGKELAKYYPVFRNALDQVVAHFTTLQHPLLHVMWADPDSAMASLLQRTDYAQPALFALQVALWRLWESWGVRARFLLGHSIGELAVAHVAGVMSLSDACNLVSSRSSLMHGVRRRGMMASLQGSAADVTAAIQKLGLSGEVDIACHNTPTQTVASGDVDAVQKLLKYFTVRGRKSKIIDVAQAFHSHHMDAMMAQFRSVAEKIHYHPPNMVIVSSLTGKLVEYGELERPSYWVQQVRQAVRFNDGIQALEGMGANVFLEVGPRSVLCGLGAACLNGDKFSHLAWLPSLSTSKADTAAILEAVAQLHVRHASFDWAAYFSSFSCERMELPTYAFQLQHPGVDSAAEVGTRAEPQLAISQKSQEHRTQSQSTEQLRAKSKPSLAQSYEAVIKPDDSTNAPGALCDQHSRPQAAFMLSFVQATVASVLGFTSPNEVDVDLPIQNIGIDSLTAVLIRDKLVASTSLVLPATAVLDYPTLRVLTQSLLGLFPEDHANVNALDFRCFGGAKPAEAVIDNVDLAHQEEFDARTGFDSDTTCGSISHQPANSAATTPSSARASNPEPLVKGQCGQNQQGHLDIKKRTPLSTKPPLRLAQSVTAKPLNRVICPCLGLEPPRTSPELFPDALRYFSNLSWCLQLLHGLSATATLLPGHGPVIPFIPQSFNPASPRHDQFVGRTLSRATSCNGDINVDTAAPLQHILSLFRPSDASHLQNPSRHIPRVATLFALGGGTSGYEGILHGGLIATLLDESLSIVHELNTALKKSSSAFTSVSVTSSLNIRYLAPVDITEEAVCVVAEVKAIQGREMAMHAELINSRGARLATAESTFVTVGV